LPVPLSVVNSSTVSDVTIDAVTTPVVVACNKFALSTVTNPLLTVRFWSVISILPFDSWPRRAVNSASSPVVIVAPESTEKTVDVPPVAVFAWVI
jgi:hypothetical protein